ncbi:sulfatase-like hydrolase/transferase [Paenibacillus sabuli]|uniref:sulfatase-like hydrolase/transferase n=1 Tax=Paenibacillus sabuli TaxID=2772509 RepID=UPI001CC32822|nr:sulfatase-like hydrolase/transferase [Paenibacillus sabuli]
MTKQNVLFFFTDDQRFDTIAALGHPEIQTPNMDKLARRGTSFTQAHIPGGTVGAVCMPSRAMLHTGRSLFRLEADGASIPDHHTLLGELLQQAGYRTFGIGKWHNGPASYNRSFSDGDEIFFGGMSDHWNVPACRYDPGGAYAQVNRRIDNPFHQNTISLQRADHVQLGKHSSELFSERAARWLEEEAAAADGSPFFMYISYLAPHDPRSMPEEYLQMYDPAKLSLPDNCCAEHPFDYGVRDIRDETLAPYPRSEQEIRRHLAEYYAMITHLDHELGNVLDALERSGQADQTLIVLAGDNGLAVGQHGLMGKQSAYEHSVRVPLILAGPGIPAGETRDTYAYLYDIYPTLCELLGLQTPDSVEGTSLAPALGDPAWRAREHLYFAYADCVRAVKDKRYKLIEYRTDELRRTQLFDLIADSAECHDLYGTAGTEEVVKALSRHLLACKEAWDDEAHPAGGRFWRLYA